MEKEEILVLGSTSLGYIPTDATDKGQEYVQLDHDGSDFNINYAVDPVKMSMSYVRKILTPIQPRSSTLA